MSDDYKPITQQEIDDGKRKAESYLNKLGFTDDQIFQTRIKAKKDLFFLGYSILGYDKLSENLHGHLAGWLAHTANEQFRIILLPRSHYKTTLDTITDSVQIVLPDDLGDSPYPRNLGPNARVLLAHEKLGSAEKFLFSITQHFTINPVLTAFFPECVPDARVQKINKNELSLPRTRIWSEPTFDTMGVGGKNQGRHYNYIKCDDIYGAEARDSKAERDTTILWFDNIQSYFVTPKTDHLDISGTRWAFDDIYQHAFNVYGDKLKRYVRAAIENGVPIFPEEFSLESFEILKKNPTVWNAQYANNPAEGAAAFKPEWLRYYNRDGRDLVVFDSSGSRRVSIDSLDRLILVDPALVGLTGVSVVGVDKDSNIYVLEACKKSFKTEELLAYIFNLAIKYRPRLVAIEEVLFSALYAPIFRNEMNKRNVRFTLELVKIGKAEKGMRVNALSNYFAAGQIYFHTSQTDLITEFNQFGATDNYHILDSISMGPKLWRAGVNQRVIDKYKEAEEKLRGGMDKVTGYSKIR